MDQQSRSPNHQLTYDEVSMEHSKSFVKALQELKNLRPQLYSAAEYCEKSYLHNEQKQKVLDDMKDYTVRALVNAVDHLGTVAYKLTDLLDQQNLDVSTVELKLSCLDQQLLTCQTYTENEGLRQQQLLAIIPRHHKHYILPNSVNKKVHFSPQIPTDARQTLQSKPRFASGTPPANTLSWHLASETKSTLKGTPRSTVNTEDLKSSGMTSGAFNLLDEGSRTKSSAANIHLPKVGPASAAAMHTLGVTRDPLDSTKPMTAFRSFDEPTKRAIVRTPVRSKSVISAFFVKQKGKKLKT